jgi:hypothetical protein
MLRSGAYVKFSFSEGIPILNIENVRFHSVGAVEICSLRYQIISNAHHTVLEAWNRLRYRGVLTRLEKIDLHPHCKLLGRVNKPVPHFSMAQCERDFATAPCLLSPLVFQADGRVSFYLRQGDIG